MSRLAIAGWHNTGQLAQMVAEAAITAIGPLFGVRVSVVGGDYLPWQCPPQGLAIMSLGDQLPGGFRAVTWVGGDIPALASLTEALIGERPETDDDLLRDCIREIANIFAGRMQALLHAAGITTGLGLPSYFSQSTRFDVDAQPRQAVAIRLRADLDDIPQFTTGFAAEEVR